MSVVKNEIEIYDGSLNVPEIYKKWYEIYQNKNCGALITFAGIVREEGGITALSFDIHKPILQSWFECWIKRAKDEGAFVLFAHSKGDVKVHESSYLAGIVSPQRKVALKLINEFVEDFKANAPIWKYDIINDERIYAKERSQKLTGAGILS